MVFADIFVWEEEDGTVKSGYVYSMVKAEKALETLKKAYAQGKVKWFRDFFAAGWNLTFGGGLRNLKIADLPKIGHDER